MHEKTKQTKYDPRPEEQGYTTDAQLTRVSGKSNEGEGYQCENETDVLPEQVRCIDDIPMFIPLDDGASGDHVVLKPRVYRDPTSRGHLKFFTSPLGLVSQLARADFRHDVSFLERLRFCFCTKLC